MLGDNPEKTIDELGLEFTAAAAEKGKERRAAAEAGGSNPFIDLLKVKGAEILGSTVTNFFTTRANKQAFQFQQREAIQAATAKYNNGVDNAIKLKQDWKESMNHKGGQRDWAKEKFRPTFEKELFKNIDEQNYTKDGIDTYLDQQLNEFVDKVYLPLFKKGNEAANRMNNTKEDFQRFIIINDGIADNLGGAVFQAAKKMVTGKDGNAIKAEARIVNSNLVKSAEAVNLVSRLMYQGLDVKDAVKVGKEFEKNRYTDADYNIEKSQTFKTEKHIIDGVEVTVGYNEVVRANDRGATRTFRVYEGDSQKFADQLNGERIEREKINIGGDLIEQQTVYSLVKGQPQDPVVRYRYLGIDPRGVENISDEASTTANNMFKEYINLTPVAEGRDQVFGDYTDIDNKSYNGGDAFSSETPVTVINAQIANKDKTTVKNASLINSKFKIKDYNENDKQLSLHIATAARMIDIRRMFDDEGPLATSTLDFGSSRRIASAEPSYLETFEAIGLVNTVKPSINIAGSMIRNAANSGGFLEELYRLKQNKAIEDRFTMRKINELRNTFLTYRKNPKYQFLFEPIIERRITVQGGKVKVIELENPVSIYDKVEELYQL
jgi:hypothetical protein